MYEWDAVKELGAYLGQGIDDALINRLSSSPDSGRTLELICRSTSVFSEIYPPDKVDLIVRAIFETDFSRLQGDGREEALSRDVFRRLSGSLELKAGEGAHEDAFANFDVFFQRSIRWFKAALKAVMSVQGLKKDEVSLENPGIMHYLAELRELPCRRLGELSFSNRMHGSATLSRNVEALLKKYEDKVIPADNCRSIMEIMNKVSGFPGYYKAMDSGQKLVVMRPLLLAISELQLDPGKEPEKADLQSALSILLFNVFPSVKLLKFVTRFKPDPENYELSYEYYAILSMNHMLGGRLDEAAACNEKALEYAVDEEKRSYTHILDSCIWLHRKDFNAAVSALSRCSSLTKDTRMRAIALFYLGIVYYEMGSVAAAHECFEKSRPGMGDELDSMNVCNNIGTCAMVQGDLEAAARAFEHVERVSKYMSSNTAKRLKSVAYGNLGIIRLSMASYELAMECFKEALRLDRDTHNKKGLANQLGNIGLALKLKGDYKLALEYFKSSLNVSFIGDYAEGVLFSFSQIEQLMALEGRYGEAESLKQDMIRQNPDIARMLRR
jgi:tetratricopeptide (TPR) repeat protein